MTCVGAALLFAAGAAHAADFHGTIFYTRHGDGLSPHNLQKARLDVVAGVATLGAPADIVSTPLVQRADGVLFAPDGDLIVGGEFTGNVYKVVPTGAGVTTVTADSTGGGISAEHVSLDYTGTRVYASDFGGTDELAEVPLDSAFPGGIGNGMRRQVRDGGGRPTRITSIAFDAAGHGFYTSSGPDGVGDVGIVSLPPATDHVSPAVVTPIFTGVPWAHGLFWDPYTSSLIASGGAWLAQLDVVPAGPGVTLSIRATKNLPMPTYPDLTLDQGGPDGTGHLLIASNSGHLLYLDYRTSRRVDAPTTVLTPFISSDLDDVAPLAGLGGPSDRTPPSCAVRSVSSSQVVFAVRDTGSGLDHVVATRTNNCTLTGFTPSAWGPGYTGEVLVTISKTNLSRSASVTLETVDVAGNVTTCDPVMADLVIPARSTTATAQFIDLAPAEAIVFLRNGAPGVRLATVTVNRARPRTLRLHDGQEVVVDGSANARSAGNTVTVTVQGVPGSRVTVVIGDGM